MNAVGRALRKHLSPLGGDTVTMLDLPPVRMGLLTKLNLLTIGLIFLAAVAVTAYHFTQTWRDKTQQLKTQAASMLGIMTDLAEYGIHTSNQAYLAQILDSLARIRTSPTSRCWTRSSRWWRNGASHRLSRKRTSPLPGSALRAGLRSRRS
jgi:hypothetical protein